MPQSSPQPGASLDNGSAGVLNVADAAIAGNDPAMALKVSQSVLASDPTNMQALYHEAAAYYAVGRCQDAIAAYKVALSIDAKSSEAQTGIGRCLLKRDAASAELAFEAAVQDDPNNAAALNDLGVARDLQGNYGGATQPYQRALLLQPGVLGTEVNLGMSLALSGDGADALQYLGPLATGADATPKIREDYAAALVAAGRTSEARQVLSVDLPPDQVNTLIAAFSTTIANAQNTAPAAVQTPAEAAPVTTVTAPITPVTIAPPAAPVAIVPTIAAPVAPAPQTSAPLSPPPVIAAPQPVPAPVITAPTGGGSAATNELLR